MSHKHDFCTTNKSHCYIFPELPVDLQVITSMSSFYHRLFDSTPSAPDILAAPDLDPRMNYNASTTALYNMEQSYLQDPSSHTIFSTMCLEWAKFDWIIEEVNQITHLCNLTRVNHMFGFWYWWSFMRTAIPDVVDAYVGETPQWSWITSVVSYIDRHSTLSSPLDEVHYASVFPNAHSSHVETMHVAYLPNTRQLRYASGQEKKNCLIHFTCLTIAQWLGIQDDPNTTLGRCSWDAKGGLLNAALSIGHPGIFVIPFFQEAFSSPSLAYSGQDDDIQPLVSDLQSLAQNDDWLQKIRPLDTYVQQHLNGPYSSSLKMHVPFSSLYPRDFPTPSLINGIE